jgi:hypothetical protein
VGFAVRMGAALPKILADKGRTVTFCPDGAAEREILAVVDLRSGTIDGGSGRKVVQLGSVLVSRDAVAGVAAWHENDAFEIDGERWEVIAPEQESDVALVLSIQKTTRVRYAGAGHESGKA